MRIALVLILILSAWSFGSWADTLDGRVVAVADGDTLTLLDSNRQQHRIRIAGIDAPEKGQPFGERSKQHLAILAFGRAAKADCYKVDRYDRDVCNVYVNGKDVGLAQLDAGLGWWYRKYANEQLPKDRVDYAAGVAASTSLAAGVDPYPRQQHVEF